MPDATKRTLAELITLHELEPDLKEIITEGRSDASVVRWFLRRSGIDAAVYGISDRLDIPPTEVRRRGQLVGNKGRVIASALGIQEDSGVAASGVTFIYDADDDFLTGATTPRADCLLRTDYTSMEMYAFANNVLDKMLKVTLRDNGDLDAEEVLTSISAPLVALAFCRLVLSEIDPPVGLIGAIERRCRFVGGRMTIDVNALILDSVNSAGGATSLGVSIAGLLSEQQIRMDACTLDIRLIIRGHDFTQICCHFLRTVYPSLFREDRAPHRQPGTFEGALMTCLEWSDLASQGLFKELLGRVGAVGAT